MGKLHEIKMWAPVKGLLKAYWNTAMLSLIDILPEPASLLQRQSSAVAADAF